MKQAQPCTITGGSLVTPDGLVSGAIRLAEGLITHVGADVEPQPGDRVLEARGQLVAPGLVDLGVFAVDKPA
ncbi:MAG: dihydroorotase, partial [Pseudomonadota bacterium]